MIRAFWHEWPTPPFYPGLLVRKAILLTIYSAFYRNTPQNHSVASIRKPSGLGANLCYIVKVDPRTDRVRLRDVGDR
jgi:hypothetical protein